MSSSEAIKLVRRSLCLEQSEFAQQIGVTTGSVCNYEKGLRTPRLPIIRKILDIAKKNKIKVSPEDFFDK